MARSWAGQLAVATSLLAVAATANAQQRTQTAIQPVRDSFAERLLDSVPHSGTRAVGMVAVGMVAGADTRTANYGVIHVRADAPVDGTLCATVSSVDGRYTARGLYAVKSPSDTLQLAYPTARLKGAGYSPGELAVSVRLGDRCNDAALPLLPAGWQPVPGSGEVGFAVNAGAGASVFTIDRSEQPSKRIDCEPATSLFKGREPAAFTHVCRVAASRLVPGGQVRVFREVAGARESEILFPFHGQKPAAKPGS